MSAHSSTLKNMIKDENTLTSAQSFSAVRFVANQNALYNQLSPGILAQEIFKIYSMTEEEKAQMQKNTQHTSMFAILESVEMCGDGVEAMFDVQNHRYLGILMDLNVCANCLRYDNIPGTKFQVCSKCKIVHYCSKKCLHEDWSEHKHQCIGCPKRVRASSIMCLHMGHMIGGFRFDSLEEKNDFFKKSKKHMRQMARTSRMKRAFNDFILDTLSDHHSKRDEVSVKAGKEKAVSNKHETLILNQMHQEGVHYLEIGETSCFYDLMGRYELRGRVYVFVKIPNKGLQMLVCQLDKLMHNFKVYRDKFRAEYLEPKPRDEDKVAWLHRRAVIAEHYKVMRGHIEQLETMDTGEIIYAFATKWSGFKFYVLNGNHMLPYGRRSHNAMFARANLWPENSKSAAEGQPRQAAQPQFEEENSFFEEFMKSVKDVPRETSDMSCVTPTRPNSPVSQMPPQVGKLQTIDECGEGDEQAGRDEPAPSTQIYHFRNGTRWRVYEGPIDDELLRMIENG